MLIMIILAISYYETFNKVNYTNMPGKSERVWEREKREKETTNVTLIFCAPFRWFTIHGLMRVQYLPLSPSHSVCLNFQWKNSIYIQTYLSLMNISHNQPYV